MSIRLVSAGATDVGRERDKNQDNFFEKVLQSSDGSIVGLFIVADGMGGHSAGEIASELIIQTISRDLAYLFENTDTLATKKLDERLLFSETATVKLTQSELEDKVRDAVRHANKVIREYAARKPEKAGDTGSTVTMMVVQGADAVIANVGDSRLYLLRDQKLHTVTEDHSLVASLVRAGRITPDDVYTHPQRNLIYRSLGHYDQIEIDVFHEDLQAGDIVLLCSDGLWEMVRDPQIAELLQAHYDPHAACTELIDRANANGGEDNISAIVVKVLEGN